MSNTDQNSSNIESSNIDRSTENRADILVGNKDSPLSASVSNQNTDAVLIESKNLGTFQFLRKNLRVILITISFVFLQAAIYLLVVDPKISEQSAVSVFLSSITIEDCIESDLSRIFLVFPDHGDLRLISDFCADRIQRHQDLQDHLLRRIKMIQQIPDGRVILWLVIIVTISGVALAALQLFASFRLAVVGKLSVIESSEMIVAKDKVSLKSSVVGLFILLMSFAFFLIYIKYVYMISFVDTEAIFGVSPSPRGGLLEQSSPPALPPGQTSNPQPAQ